MFGYHCGDAEETQLWSGPVNTVGSPAGSWTGEICWPVWPSHGHLDKELYSVGGLGKAESSHCALWNAANFCKDLFLTYVEGEGFCFGHIHWWKLWTTCDPGHYSYLIIPIFAANRTHVSHLCKACVGVTGLCETTLVLTFPGIIRTRRTEWGAGQILILPSFSCQSA